MSTSVPSHGRVQLQYLRPSDDADRNDYRLTGTVEWDDQSALDCFDAGTVDWAYEHSITYGEQFHRNIWNVNLSEFQDAGAGPYIDTTASDGWPTGNGQHTDLSFGLFRPERLTAGVDYHFSYDIFLPAHPAGGKHWILVGGQVLEKQCSKSGPWCVGLNDKGYSTDPPYIGWKRGFSVTGTTCWAWHVGQDPVDCSPPEQPATPATPTPSNIGQTTPTPPPVTPTTEPTPASGGQPTPATPAPPAPPTHDTGTGPAVTTPANPAPVTATGNVNGCNTYGQNCDSDPLYVNVPQDGYNWRTEPKVTTVPNGTALTARCWASGGTTYNWAVTQNDPGPNPYDSNIYFLVQSPDHSGWGYIPDTYFVRDKVNKMGLPHC